MLFHLDVSNFEGGDLLGAAVGAHEMTLKSIIREGILVGLTGAAIVALWFFVYDLGLGAPFQTPALLGATLFHGLRDPGALVITTGLVVQYTILHAAAFIVFGVATSGLFALADQDRRVLFLIFMLFCCFEVAALLLIMVLAEHLLEELAPWAILVGNLFAMVGMLGLLLHRHHRSPAEFLVANE